MEYDTGIFSGPIKIVTSSIIIISCTISVLATSIKYTHTIRNSQIDSIVSTTHQNLAVLVAYSFDNSTVLGIGYRHIVGFIAQHTDRQLACAAFRHRFRMNRLQQIRTIPLVSLLSDEARGGSCQITVSAVAIGKILRPDGIGRQW